MSIKLDLENSITFERPLTRVVKQNIRIENPNSTPIAFKVKTTAPRLYCVRPNSDIIGPNESVEIQILLQALKEEPAADAKCKDKFLILSTLVEGPLESMNITDLWNHVEKEKKSSIHERKLRCVYSPVKQTNDALAAEVVAPAPVAREVKTSTTSSNDKEVAEKLKLMEQELLKYKKEVETLRDAEPVIIEKVQIKNNGLPVSIFILFALLAIAVAYFLQSNNHL